MTVAAASRLVEEALSSVPRQRSHRALDDALFAQVGLASLPDTCVAVLDEDLVCRAFGGAALWPGGIDPTRFCGRHVSEMMPVAQWEETREHYVAALAGRTTDERQVGFAGQVYRTVYGPAYAEDDVVGVVVRFREVGAVEEAERQAAQALELFELSFATAPIGKALVDPDGSFVKVNPALCALVGRSEADLLACTFQDITHPDDLQADLDLYESVLAGERDRYQMDKRYMRPSGEVVHVQLDVAAARNLDGSVRLFVAQIQDVTARKHTEGRLTRLATRDPLTELRNRASFRDALEHAVRQAGRARRPALLLIDLDHFKDINDTEGHLAGDRHLIAVANTLIGAVRRGDLVARVGGDEFAILLPNAMDDEASIAASRYTTAIDALSTGRGGSVGIAMWQPGDTPDTLFDRADRDMYRAKRRNAKMRAHNP